MRRFEFSENANWFNYAYESYQTILQLKPELHRSFCDT